MSLIGGSPLGLIGMRSVARPSGMSYFNGGDSRNINVDNYNRGVDDYPITNLSYTRKGDIHTVETNYGTRSMFTGGMVIAPYKFVGKMGADTSVTLLSSKYTGINRRQLHNDKIYDLSILNIIQQLSGTEAGLRPSDFAYLKNLGVFPNNRLMIARRFISPHVDNIFGKGKEGTPLPMAVMISWKPQGDDFLDISFGEIWESAKADFVDVLNSLGGDFNGKGLGTKIDGGLGAVPLSGWTESLQRTVYTKLGLMEDDINVSLPSGNPNLIKEAKKRKTIPYGVAGSGLTCKVSIRFVCEWEQDFLSNIDPTVVFQDILMKVGSFSTSVSNNYGLSGKFQAKMEQYINNPTSLLTDFITFIREGLVNAKNALINSVQNVQNVDVSAAIDNALKFMDNTLARQIQKYKIELLGIARALTGLPSTPWHVTLGNPMKPTFCSGDMYIEGDTKLTLGPTLAFNDLPSTIKAEFTLTNARPWGLQEILSKFNAGSVRISTIKDENDRNVGDAPNTPTDPDAIAVNMPNNNASSSVSKTSLTNNIKQGLSIPDEVNPNQTAGIQVIKQSVASASSSTKFGSLGEKIVSDANSTNIITLT